ncbi:hypothetical protein B0J13DRAFT_226792 [Dactylonectria estremocensis]|uniref:Uncharacterized protein n=1 Tax=Dactylonectria estremocensis TaxID=1079267 RepID=A0A9P9J998_9HYPO|nr:hypothetical protein B0J13DRAFT_226792 [Dactylonectria estremocensis]
MHSASHGPSVSWLSSVASRLGLWLSTRTLALVHWPLTSRLYHPGPVSPHSSLSLFSPAHSHFPTRVVAGRPSSHCLGLAHSHSTCTPPPPSPHIQT